MDEPKSVDLSRWMDQMSDVIGSRPLKDVVIPGTHDSAMYPNLQHIDFAKCQDLDFTEQLNFGVRFFDFRCGYFTRNGAIIQDADGPVTDLALNFAKTPGYFMFGHGPGPQTKVSAVSVADTLAQITSWLSAHPREVVILKVTPVCKSGAADVLKTVTGGLGDRLYSQPSGGPTLPNTTIDQLRGKVVMFTQTDKTWHRSVGYKDATNGIQNAGEMLKYLQTCLDQERPKGQPAANDSRLLELQATLTPYGDGTPPVVMPTPYGLATAFNPLIVALLSLGTIPFHIWGLDDPPPWRGRALNIVSVDYVDMPIEGLGYPSVASALVRANYHIES